MENITNIFCGYPEFVSFGPINTSQASMNVVNKECGRSDQGTDNHDKAVDEKI